VVEQAEIKETGRDVDMGEIDVVERAAGKIAGDDLLPVRKTQRAELGIGDAVIPERFRGKQQVVRMGKDLLPVRAVAVTVFAPCGHIGVATLYLAVFETEHGII
jgi:hypothetical protein